MTALNRHIALVYLSLALVLSVVGVLLRLEGHRKGMFIYGVSLGFVINVVFMLGTSW